MARQRYIKPAFFSDDKVVLLPTDARLSFIALLCYVDDEGRCEERITTLRLFAWPGEAGVTDEKMERHLRELEAKDMIIRYEAAGKKLIQVRNFTKHQPASPHNRASHYPPPEPLTEESLRTKLALSDLPEGMVPVEGFPIERARAHKVSSYEVSGSDIDNSSSSSKELLRSSSSKAILQQQLDSTSPQRLAFGALCFVTNQDPSEVTAAAAAHIGKCAREIVSVYRGDDIVGEIYRRAENYRGNYPGAILTPSALVKHWAISANANEQRSTVSRLLAQADREDVQ